jgi:hypothetical protein
MAGPLQIFKTIDRPRRGHRRLDHISHGNKAGQEQIFNLEHKIEVFFNLEQEQSLSCCLISNRKSFLNYFGLELLADSLAWHNFV